MSTLIRKKYDKGQKVTITFANPSKTKKSFKNECDVNNILKKYKATGVINHVNGAQPQFGDFSDVKDYREALDVVIAAQDSFMQLPAHIRKEFGNDPAKFVDFASKAENNEKLVEWGLATKREKNIQEKTLDSLNQINETLKSPKPAKVKNKDEEG